MGDLSKLKVAIGQMEIVDGRPSRNEAALDRAVDAALDDGADVLIAPGSLTDDRDVRLISLNDSRLDIAGDVAVLDACGETYRISLGCQRENCDFSTRIDLSPFSLRNRPQQPARSQVVIKPVGIRDTGKKVSAFDGGSCAYDDKGGRVVSMRDDFSEGVCTFSFDGSLDICEPCDKKLLTAIVATMRRFDAQVMRGGSKWVIGLSGGLDSSVVAALLVLAFGPERVVGYNMATRFNSAATRGNAARVAESLGFELRGGSIEDMVVALGNTLVRYGYPTDALRGVVLENAQARTRGQLLSTFAALEGGVVVNNGNRIEGALGYATMYGDAIGALAPIGDVSKVELFELSRDINETFGYEVVPANLLPTVTDEGYTWDTMPSAELANGQVDPMKWFYHDWLVGQLLGDGQWEDHESTYDEPYSPKTPGMLDEAACTIMEQYFNDRLLDTKVGKWVRFYGLDDPSAFVNDFDWVLSSMRKSVFKRIQSPPLIALANPGSVYSQIEPQVAPEPSQRYLVLASKLRKL